MIWHLRHARATAMPCLCGPGEKEPCRPRLPAALLPNPVATEQALIDEAVRGWATWARLFVDFTDIEQPAQRALAAAREWGAQRTPSAG